MKQAKNTSSSELGGIIFFFASTLLACSLITYDWHDIRFLSSPSTSHNSVGVLGAYLGFFLYSLIGWTANLIPLVTLYLALSCFFRPDFRARSSALWFLLFLVSLAGMLEVLGVGAGWARKNNNLGRIIQNPGVSGMWGTYVVQMLLVDITGKLGTFLLFLTGAATGLYFSLQIHPATIRNWYLNWQEERREQKREDGLRSSDPKVRLRTQEEILLEKQKTVRDREQEIADQARQIERELNKRQRELRSSSSRSTPPAPDETPSSNREKTVRESRAAAKKPDTEPPARQPSSTTEKKAAPSVPETPSDPAAAAAPGKEAPPPPALEERETPAIAAVTAPMSVPRTPRVKRRAPLSPVSIGDYHLPQVSLLHSGSADRVVQDGKEEIARKGALLVATLKDFGIEVQMSDITQGPTFTRYEVIPSPGIRVERIVSLQSNLAMALKVEKINILAPVAGKGSVGLEVPNNSRAVVRIRDVIESAEFQSSRAKIPLALGRDVYGKTIVADLAGMPHLLVGGSTGTGKSVCINSIIASLLYKFSPDDMRLILIDPKVVELQVYNPLPHLVVPVVTEPKKSVVALRWVVREMETRYKIMAKVGVRNVHAFNARPKQAKNERPSDDDADSAGDQQPMLLPEEELIIPDKMPFIVVFIDELADLMQTAKVDAEDAITRITQMARAAGIHLIVATQTPRADIVTGVIKTNLPSRVALKTSSGLDSRVILDEMGAENLLGRGDMIFKPSDSDVFLRLQGALIENDEVSKIVNHCSRQAKPQYDSEMQEKLSKPTQIATDGSEDDDELAEKCIEVIQREGRISTSLLQRRLGVGYSRAARLMDLLEERGVVGPQQGSRDREILIPLAGSPPSP